MTRGAAMQIQPRDVIEQPPALPWDSLHQLFGTMGKKNSGNLTSATARYCWVSVVGNRGDHHPPGYARASQSVGDTGAPGVYI
jgi:hypothetical protein